MNHQMAFSACGLLATIGGRNKKSTTSAHPSSKPRKKKSKEISSCLGVQVKMQDRLDMPNPYSYACSLRCRHPVHNIKERSTSMGKTDEWTSETIYKKYTDTDSRPVTPDQSRHQKTNTTIPSVVLENRKCITPEPETKQCQIHQRRVLILDLRRVKSVDAIIHQDSTSVDSTYEDDEGDKSSSTVNADSISMFQHLPSRALSMSRSATPKTRLQVRRPRKAKERSASPIAYERCSSPKILEGVSSL